MDWLDQVLPEMRVGIRERRAFESSARVRDLDIHALEAIHVSEFVLLNKVGTGTLVAFYDACGRLGLKLHPSFKGWHKRATGTQEVCPTCQQVIRRKRPLDHASGS